MDVSVHQHSVRVTLERGERSLVVVQRQAAHYRNGQLQLTRQTAGDDAWRRGWLVIDRQPLPQALAQLNRYRATRIVAVNPALRARTVSGVFALNKLDDGVGAIRQELSARQLNLLASRCFTERRRRAGMPVSPLFSLSVKNLYGFLPPGTSLCLNKIDFHYHLVWHSFGWNTHACLFTREPRRPADWPRRYAPRWRR
ncbi:hypothetical protein M5585_26355 [Serratia ureilytica]